MRSTPCLSIRFWNVSLLLLATVQIPVWGDDSRSLPTRRTAVVSVVEKSKAAVVNIYSERQTIQPYGDRSMGGSGRSNGMGTGVILDPRGYIVTNYHVVDDVTKLQVRLSGDDDRYDAVVIAKDKETDL
ncbi:MAG TPA: trypsin-like peptidase domain-containing protein, partial [Gemmatales bacterium]|nr:trypsin-like peptidase domain-containing protein [Gemmatales bacterium]